MWAGLLVVRGGAVWVNELQREQLWGADGSPGLCAMSRGFLGGWACSVTDTSERAREERGRYLAQFIRSMTGIGAAGTSKH